MTGFMSSELYSFLLYLMIDGMENGIMMTIRFYETEIEQYTVMLVVISRLRYKVIKFDNICRRSTEDFNIVHSVSGRQIEQSL